MAVGGDRVDAGEGRDRRLLDGPPVGVAAVEDPVVAEGVRQDVGRHQAVDPGHHEEGAAEHRGVRLVPEGLGHRDRGVLAHQAA